MAKSREPNKAFGYLRAAPGNKGNAFGERVEATLIGAYAEIERRLGRQGEAVLDGAGAHFGVSKNTARARLKLSTQLRSATQ